MSYEILTPFPFASLPLLWEWIESFRHKVLDDDGPRDQAAFVDLYIERLKGGDLTWGVAQEDRLVGFVSMTPPVGNGISESLSVWRRDAWGARLIVPAVSEIYQRVFAGGAVTKIHSSIFADFHAMADMLKQIGFQQEGRLRGVKTRAGLPVDVKVFGLYQSELQKCSETSSEQALACSAAS